MHSKISSIGLAVTLTILFGLETLYSQSKVKQEHARTISPALEAAWKARIPQSAFSHSQRPGNSSRDDHTEVLGYSYYDYAENSGRKLALTPGGVHIVFTELQSPTQNRYAAYDFFDESLMLLYGYSWIAQILGSTAWSRVLNGKNDEAVVCFRGGGNWLYGDYSQANYTFSNMLTSGGPVSPGSVPGVALNPATDEIWFTGTSRTDSRFAPHSFFYSNNYGATFAQMTFPSSFPNSIPVNKGVWPVLNPANNSEVAFAMVESDPNGLHTPVLSWHITSDNGASWTSTNLYEEAKWFSDPAGDYSYLISNFNQFNNMYTADGTFHVVFNGYGLVDSANGGDTLAIFPVVYWNSINQQFVELTDPAVGHNIDGDFSNAVLAGYPGNSIGNAHPTIAVEPVTNTLIVLWQQVEVDANGLPVIAPDTSGNPSGFYATDIWGTISPDNGSYWFPPFKVAGRPGHSDVFPAIAREMRRTGDSTYIYFYFYEDEDPGLSLFGEGDAVLGQWIFECKGFWFYWNDHGVEPVDHFVKQITLDSNHPNPFNPTTVISWYLSVGSEVQLTIYNLLGQKIRTLVNARQTAGNHQVEWGGRDDQGKEVASGVYIYRLKAGDQVISKKMLLLR